MLYFIPFFLVIWMTLFRIVINTLLDGIKDLDFQFDVVLTSKASTSNLKWSHQADRMQSGFD